MILNEFFNLPQVFEKDMTEGNGRDLTNTPRDQFISRMTPSMDANALRQKVAKIVNSPGFTEDTILQIVDAGDNLSHPAGRYIQQAFYGLQYNLGKEYEDYPERVAEKLLSQFRSMLPAYRVTEADEWEEDTEKRERFLKYAKQKLNNNKIKCNKISKVNINTNIKNNIISLMRSSYVVDNYNYKWEMSSGISDEFKEESENYLLDDDKPPAVMVWYCDLSLSNEKIQAVNLFFDLVDNICNEQTIVKLLD